MRDYEIHFFDRLNVRFLVRALQAPDDAAAETEAARHTQGHAIELWEGSRKVLRLERLPPVPKPKKPVMR